MISVIVEEEHTLGAQGTQKARDEGERAFLFPRTADSTGERRGWEHSLQTLAK